MPGYTETDIANLALGHLGDRRINDLSDTNDTNAEVIADVYNHAVGVAYVAHDWRWAMDAAQLQLLPTAPATRWGYEYALPANFVRPSNVAETFDMWPLSEEWDVLGMKFRCNLATVFLEFVANHWDESQWPAYFAEAVAVKIAALAGPRITHNMGVRAEMERLYANTALVSARVTDSQFQPARRRIIRSEWKADRFGRGFRNRLRPEIS